MFLIIIFQKFTIFIDFFIIIRKYFPKFTIFIGYNLFLIRKIEIIIKN